MHMFFRKPYKQLPFFCQAMTRIIQRPSLLDRLGNRDEAAEVRAVRVIQREMHNPRNSDVKALLYAGDLFGKGMQYAGDVVSQLTRGAVNPERLEIYRALARYDSVDALFDGLTSAMHPQIDKKLISGFVQAVGRQLHYRN
jgi:hypothetical protein